MTRVALDVEGVLANVHGAFLPEYNDEHGTDYQPSDVTHWEWMGDEIPHDEFIEWTDEMWAERWWSIPPAENNLWMTVADLNEGVEGLDIVTARTGVESEVKAWLLWSGIRPGDYDEFVSIDRSRSKAELGYDVYVDDKPYLAEKLGRGQMQYMIARPYNDGYGDHERAARVGSVYEAVAEIAGLPKQ